MTVFIRLVTVAAAASLGAGAVATDSYTTDFESGADNWIAYAGSALEPTGGNPDGHIHTVFSDFGITYRNNTNPNFVMDYSAFDSVTFSIDVKVESIGSFGLFNPRPWVIELRDYDNPPAGYNYVSVWHEFMWLPGTGLPWTTFDVTIDDPSAVDLPAGWGGDGASDLA
ncbi:MAG: hypothetical protein KDA25_09975, partial [Phycisphaerales bacterium]|nr:hypothetical protein [Phycisphaerales bacterium]